EMHYNQKFASNQNSREQLIDIGIFKDIKKVLRWSLNSSEVESELNIKDANIKEVPEVHNNNKNVFNDSIENKDLNRLVNSKLIRTIMQIWVRIIWKVMKEITMGRLNLAYDTNKLCFNLEGSVRLD
ncbi:4587_t:CDS:2, partial [Gigaspora rosea]